MPSTPIVDTSLPGSGVSSRRQDVADGLAGLPLGQVPARRAQKRDDEKNGRRWAFTRAIAPFFDRAIEVYLRDRNMKAATFADEIGVDATALSRMRVAERMIDADHLEPLRLHPPSALLLAQGELARAGLVASVRHAVAFTAADVRDWLAEWVLRDRRTREKALDDIAREKGLDVEDIEAVLDESREQPGEQAPMQHAPVAP